MLWSLREKKREKRMAILMNEAEMIKVEMAYKEMGILSKVGKDEG